VKSSSKIRQDTPANTKAFLKEADYWRELEEKEVCTQLPKDRQSGDQRMRHTRTVSFSLTPEQTEQLTTNVHEAYHTEMNDILLTALGLALKEWTGEVSADMKDRRRASSQGSSDTCS
jgi:surfactin family lipopeptide synthetase A